MAKKKDTGPLFEGMVLTEWQKLSNSIFGGWFRKKARADTDLMKTLSQADIRVMPEVYKATNLLSTIFATLGCIGLLALIFLTFLMGSSATRMAPKINFRTSIVSSAALREALDET